MRTTLTIDDDVLLAAKELARRQRRSAGSIISELARRALTMPVENHPSDTAFLGFEPLPRGCGVVTNESVDQIREEEGI